MSIVSIYYGSTYYQAREIARVGFVYLAVGLLVALVALAFLLTPSPASDDGGDPSPSLALTLALALTLPLTLTLTLTYNPNQATSRHRLPPTPYATDGSNPRLADPK